MIKAEFLCPYCKTSNTRSFAEDEVIDARPETFLCDLAVGGCDNWFVIKPIFTFSMKTYSIRSICEQTEKPPTEAKK